MSPRPESDLIEPEVEPISLQDGTLLREDGAASIYIIYGGARFEVPSLDELAALGFSESDVQTVPAGSLASVRRIPRDRTLLQERASPAIYYMQRGTRLLVPNVEVFGPFGLQADDVRVVPAGGLASIAFGGRLSPRRIGLEAILRPGRPPSLVPRSLGGEYVVLPSVSVFVRLREPWPESATAIDVAIDGTSLEWTRSDDLPRQEALTEQGLGFYVVNWGPTTFDVVVVPPPRLRTGQGFLITVTSSTTAPDGAREIGLPLRIDIVSAVNKRVTEPSEVFFTGRDYGERLVLNSKNPEAIVARDVVLAGWLFAAPEPHTTEDVYYWFILDADFFLRMYGPGGVSTALREAVLPGNMGKQAALPEKRLPLADRSEVDGTSRGINLNSVALPMNGVQVPGEPPDRLPHVYVFGELNCWHVEDGGGWKGRGRAPTGWVRVPLNGYADSWWPYNPYNPDGSPRDLQSGDYVILKGTLFQDNFHDTLQPWQWEWWRGPMQGHDAWLELHPIDWIERAERPFFSDEGAPNVYRKTTALVAIAVHPDAADPTKSARGTIAPDFEPSSPGKELRVRSVEALVDGRFTDTSTVDFHTVTPGKDHVVVAVRVTNRTGRQGRFKAVYIVSWEERDRPPPPPPPPTGNLVVSATPYPVPLGRPVQVTVSAVDDLSGTPVNGRVLIDEEDVAATNTPFTYTLAIRRIREPDGEGGWTWERFVPTGVVQAPGYPEAAIDFGVA